MTDARLTSILCIIDRSGSMLELAEPMNHALADLMREQSQLPGLTTVDVVVFDHEATRTHHLADPRDIEIKIEPRGGTALYDAIGLAIYDFDAYIRALPEHARPATVQVVVVSDGEDTRSTEYSASTIRALVRAREADGWQFTFLGAGLDAEEAAEDLGTARGNGVGFDRDAKSVRMALAQTSRRMAEGRKRGSSPMARRSTSRAS